MAPEFIDLRKRLADGPQLGFGVMWPSPGLIERVGVDWDWFWIDGQHGQYGYSEILNCVRATNLVDTPSVVRVPGHDAGVIGKVLDTACEGIMVPLVDNADQARQIVQAVKFSPMGYRSFGGRRPIDLYTRSYSHQDITQPLLVCQIETQTAVENVEEIAAVDGVDVVFFGPDDMAMRAGMPMDKPRPAGYFDEEFKKVADAAEAAGKLAGGVFPMPDQLTKAVDMGYRLIAGGGDAVLLPKISKERSQMLRECLAGRAGVDKDKDQGQVHGAY